MAELYKTKSGKKFHAGSIAIVTVGLPARGKTFMARKLSRYLRWLGVRTRVFNVGVYRRQLLQTHVDYTFFDPNNESLAEQRRRIANTALEDLISWLKAGGQVAIYDAANTDKERRDEIYKLLTDQKIQVVFIEALCDKQEMIEDNIREVKITSPDYDDVTAEEAFEDFKRRIAWYLPRYTSVDEAHYSYVHFWNAGERLVVNEIHGYLQTRFVYYLMNLQMAPRTIYLCRHGESVADHSSKADVDLSPRGRRFARRLRAFFAARQPAKRPLAVWTSFRRRSLQTVAPLKTLSLKVEGLEEPMPVVHVQQALLKERHPGLVEGLRESEIRRRFPDEHKRYLEDPYRHRYPRAESYHDVALRLENILLELERQSTHDVLIIGHPTILRCLYAYFVDRPEYEIPFLDVPSHVLVEITPRAYGCTESRYRLLRPANETSSSSLQSLSSPSGDLSTLSNGLSPPSTEVPPITIAAASPYGSLASIAAHETQAPPPVNHVQAFPAASEPTSLDEGNEANDSGASEDDDASRHKIKILCENVFRLYNDDAQVAVVDAMSSRVERGLSVMNMLSSLPSNSEPPLKAAASHTRLSV